jgi:hypothetical protein
MARPARGIRDSPTARSSARAARHVGRRFADWIAGETTVAPHLADLARLEWARVEVFDAADARAAAPR